MFDSDVLISTAAFQRIADAVQRRLEAQDYAGRDPYDALNSALFSALPISRLPLARLAWTQALKQSPVDVRRLVGVPLTANAVTIALAAEAYRRSNNRDRAEAMARRLLEMESRGGGWGYPFAWQAKAFYVPAGAPNIIATAYAVRELRHWMDQDVPGVAEAIFRAAELIAANFIRESRGGRFIAYVRESDAMVHNASLWGAFTLAAAARLGGSPDWQALAGDAVAYSIGAQRPDGSWAYGEARHHQFTDGFHTGYVLEALQRIGEAAPGIDARSAVRKGLDYYVTHLFESDGTAKYYANKRDPVDANAAAQAVIALDALGCDLTVGVKALQRAIDWLWQEDRGHFAYQAGARGVNRIEYPRWTQIWMLVALRIVLSARAPEAP